MKYILWQQTLAANIMTQLIATGEDTDLRYDPWINHKSLIDLIGWNTVFLNATANSKVSCTIQDWQLQPHILYETREVASQIMQVKLSTDMPTD